MSHWGLSWTEMIYTFVSTSNAYSVYRQFNGSCPRTATTVFCIVRFLVFSTCIILLCNDSSSEILMWSIIHISYMYYTFFILNSSICIVLMN